MFNKKQILFLILLFQYFTGEAVTQDAWLWNTISLDKKINKKWSVGLDEEMRLRENMTQINLYFTNVGVDYHLTKNIKLSIVYRFIQKNQDTYYSKRHRLYFDASYKYKIDKDFTLSYRLRVQGQMRDIYSSDDGTSIESYMRHKFDLSYSLKNFTPYFAVEFRYQFNNPDFHEGDNLWNRERYYLGLNYEIDKQNTIGTYYMIQHDFNNLRLENDFTLGFQYSHSF